MSAQDEPAATIDNLKRRLQGAELACHETSEALARCRTTNTILYGAVCYALNRAQMDPDFGYYCGPATQVFEELCKAEAAMLGLDVEAVRSERANDLQPEHSRREPAIVEAREHIRRLERELDELKASRRP